MPLTRAFSHITAHKALIQILNYFFVLVMIQGINLWITPRWTNLAGLSGAELIWFRERKELLILNVRQSLWRRVLKSRKNEFLALCIEASTLLCTFHSAHKKSYFYPCLGNFSYVSTYQARFSRETPILHLSTQCHISPISPSLFHLSVY